VPKLRTYNTAITIEASDWLSLAPTPGTYPLGDLGKLVVSVNNRKAMPGAFPLSKPKDGYLDAVSDHLDRLSNTNTGHNLMLALMATGHTVIIRPPGKTVMTMSRTGGVSISQTQTNFDDAYVMLVRHMRLGNAVAARGELQAAMNAAQMMGHTAADLANVIQDRVNSYNGQQCLNGVAGAPVAITARAINVTAANITAMVNGPAALADGHELRYLCLALERFLQHGAGTNTTITFDPWAPGLGMLARPPYISLGHELLHALDAMRGTRIFDNEPEEECIYISRGSFGQIACGGGGRTLTENTLRTALAQPQRTLI